MTEDELSKEKKLRPVGVSEVIAVPRENLIATAIHFLVNPTVKDSPAYQKKAFLQSKGLTDEEVAIAFERANVKSPPTGNLLPVAPPLPRTALYQPVTSVWTRINHIGSSFIIIAIACYGIHRVYKLYIEPWLFGEQKKEDRLALVEQQLIELNRSLSYLRRSVSSIEDTVATQRTQLNKLCQEAVQSSELVQNPLIFNDIKSEISSVKSLLLGRQRFPPAPSVSPTIPSWQLESSTEKKSEENTSEKDAVPEVEEKSAEEPVPSKFESNSVSEECDSTPEHDTVSMPVSSESNSVAANGEPCSVAVNSEPFIVAVNGEPSSVAINVEPSSVAVNGEPSSVAVNEVRA